MSRRPGGWGLGWTVQSVPSQCSTRGPTPASPKAVQSVADRHDTPKKSPWPVGVGVGWITQPPLVHRSASV
jgi:hypothetical protein